ncbi:MAG: aminoacetone oxidase family FAD-binding enzyme [Victivallales bacterium]|nr:aminoacetone oxidase family FAD-binding enzyme [Victivallales bacterium]
MQKKLITCDCLVIGAGPAGLSAAIAAAESNLSVIIAEYLPSPGRKLLISGSGKCNITNRLLPEEFAQRFLSNFRFVRPAIFDFPPEDLRNSFDRLGVPLVAPDGFHFFPKSMCAKDVLNALLDRCQTLKVKIIPNCAIDSLQLHNGAICGASTSTQSFESSRVILACGGMSYPALGGRGSGYKLSQQANHTIVLPVPALVGLKSAEAWATKLPGVILADSTVKFFDCYSGRGELIFTHSGVSGPAILDISGQVTTVR